MWVTIWSVEQQNSHDISLEARKQTLLVWTLLPGDAIISLFPDLYLPLIEHGLFALYYKSVKLKTETHEGRILETKKEKN